MNDGIDARQIESLAARLRQAARVTVLTGAGVSAASGVPTFRGDGGLWRSVRPEDLATPDAFARNPRLVWEWYDWRRQVIARSAVNAAHVTLAAWSHALDGFTLITQNVDGLHEQAGTREVLRLHGSMWRVRCAGTAGESVRCTAAPRENRTVPLDDLPPRCDCGGWLRPDIVWFGEALDAKVVQRARAATACEVFVVAGTSSVVHPAAGLVDLARAQGAYTVEVNPDVTEATARVHLSVRGAAEVVLPRVHALLQAAS